MCTTEVHISGGRWAVECGTWLRPCWEIWELSSLKHHSLILRPILCNSAVLTLKQQFKTIDSNNFTLSSMLFPKCMAHIERKAVYTYFSTFPHIHSFSCGMWESDWITTCVFFESTSLILVNLRDVASGKKCCFRR